MSCCASAARRSRPRLRNRCIFIFSQAQAAVEWRYAARGFDCGGCGAGGVACSRAMPGNVRNLCHKPQQRLLPSAAADAARQMLHGQGRCCRTGHGRPEWCGARRRHDEWLAGARSVAAARGSP